VAAVSVRSSAAAAIRQSATTKAISRSQMAMSANRII
jgi:hypothetical protein